MKRTKTKLVSSIVTLLICFAMLIGSTFAWFTDSASTGVNTIQAGNLDIEVSYKKPDGSYASIQDATTLFGRDLWEPGHTEYVTLKVENKGTLALKYKVMVTPVSENGGINVDNENFKLSDHLVFGTTPIVTTEPSYTRETVRAAVGETKGLTDVNALTKTYEMAKGAAPQYITLVVYMPETVNNKANAKSGTTAPSIDLGIKVVATQVENESDSFDKNYDADADQDNFYKGGAYYDYFEAVNVTATATENNTFEVKKEDTNSGVIASASGIATEGSKVNLVVTKTSTPSNNFGITVQDGHELNGYDIKVTGQQENSVVQGTLYVGTGLENFMFYHNGRPMTPGRQGSLTDGEYCYNKDNGYVYFATSTFSPFQATYKAPVAAIGTAVYGSVQDAIMASQTSATEATVITVLKDVEGGSSFGYPDSTRDAGRNVIIDFAGHSYEFLTPGMGSSSTENQAMHLIYGNTMTLRNGKLSVSKDSTDIKRMIQSYCDLTLENMIIDCTHVKSIYNNSFCRGKVTIKGNTKLISSNSDAIIFDVDGSYSGGTTVEVQFDSSFVGSVSGNIEYVSAKTGRSAILKLENGDFTKSKLLLTNCTNNSKMTNISKADSVDIELPEGYIWDSNAVKYVVGKIGDILYADLNKAVQDIVEGDTLYILKDTELPSSSLKNNLSITGVNNNTVLTVPSTQSNNKKTGLIVDKTGFTISNLTLSSSYNSITSNEYYGVLDIREGDTTIDNVRIPSIYGNVCAIVVKKGLDADERLTISNSVLNSNFKTINFVDGANGLVIIDHCDITGTYTFNVNSASSQNLELQIKNSALHGWTSYGDIKSATFTGTEFSKGSSGYDFIRPYADTTFTDCTFDSELLIGAGADGKIYHVNNCYKNGTRITCENIEGLLLDMTGSDGTHLLQTEIFVDGNKVDLTNSGN